MQSPQHIVIIGPAHPLRGGLASYNERLARAFQQQGHRVTLYTFSLQYPGFLFPGTTQYSDEPAPADLDIQLRIHSVNPINWIRVGRELRRRKPDLIVVRYWIPFMGPCLGTLLRQVRKNGHTRIVCIADNIHPHEKRPGDKAFTRYFLKPVDAFVTMSQKVLDDLRQFDARKPAVYVPHPLYDNFGEPVSRAEARTHLQLPADKPLVLFFGFIRKYKGLDLLLDAIHLLQQDPLGRTLRFLIAGEFYEDEKPYHEQIRSLNIGNALILHTRFIPDSEVKYYLCAADLLVQPYRQATQSGVTPLAYHFEVPMVVTRVGGLPSLVPDGKVGLVAEPQAQDLADKILRYFHTGAESFLPHLREEKKSYSWDRMVQTLLSL